MTVQHTHGHGSTTTVVESDREGPATALIVLIALIVVGALIWFFAFSGIVYDRGGDVNIQNPPAQNDAPNTVTNNNTDVNTNESPAPTGT